MSEKEEAQDYIKRKKIENRKELDAAELAIFTLALPDKAKLLCLYFLRTCDWLSFTRDEGRAVLAQVLGCSADQVSRYTRPLNDAGVIRIVKTGSNLSGKVHTYRIEIDHKFWTGDVEVVAEVAAEIKQRSSKRRVSREQPCSTSQTPRAAIAECGHQPSRTRPSDQPDAASEPAEHAALPLLPPSSPSPPTREEGGWKPFEPKIFPQLPVKDTQVTDKELTQIVQKHDLVKPEVLIAAFPRSSKWSYGLRERIQGRLQCKYCFVVFDGRYDTAQSYCPNDRRIILIMLINHVGITPSDPLNLEIKHLYPEAWPSESTGTLAIDEEKAAINWLKDPDRSGTNSSFLNSKRDQVLSGRPLTPNQRASVIQNWKNAVTT